MKSISILVLSVMVILGLGACDRFGLKKKTPDYRESYYGYYKTQTICERFNTLPDPPSGILSDNVTELKVEKGTADSTILVNGESFKMDASLTFYKEEDFGTSSPRNYTLLRLYTVNKNDSIYLQRSSGTQSLYEVCISKGGFTKDL